MLILDNFILMFNFNWMNLMCEVVINFIDMLFECYGYEDIKILVVLWVIMVNILSEFIVMLSLMLLIVFMLFFYGLCVVFVVFVVYFWVYM